MKSYSGRIQLAVLWVALGGAVLGQTLHDRVASITAALRNGEFDHALDLLKPALEAAPNNPQLQMLQGLAYSGKGNRDEALISYRAALKIAPNYLPALEGAAQLEYEAGRAGCGSAAGARAQAGTWQRDQPRHARGAGI